MSVLTFLFGGWVVERLGAATERDWLAAARWFAPTALPIAAAYEVAYNYPYVIRNLGHLPFFVLMIGYTVLSLWLISQPVVSG